MTSTVQRIDRGILLQGSALAEVEWVLRRGAREIWRTDSVAPSSRLSALLHELKTLNARQSALPPAGSGNFPRVDDPASLNTETVCTSEAARLIGVGPRQMRNLSGRLAGRQVGGRLVFDLAVVQAEAARRRKDSSACT
ncbi:MAG: hypothetical protein ACR2LE_03280 [Nocardioidaceae bacterium]